jgi:cell division protein FtsQ
MTRDPAATAGVTAGSRGSRASRRIVRTTSLSAPYGLFGGVRQALARRWSTLFVSDVPRGVGTAAAALVLVASIGFGIVRGGHLPIIVGVVTEACHRAGNAAGFRIASIALSGNKHLTREEILAIAGVTGHSSLLFLDAGAARRELMSNPWIADATVQKLYPQQLQVIVREREAYAQWQHQGRLSVIAVDGTVLQSYVAPRFANLPLVVGRGAETRAKDFLDELNRHPEVRELVRASVLVAERRWNLRLKNGIDVRLPETDPGRALETISTLDREKKLLTRDVAAIDLRQPDRVTVQLSDAATAARENALKDKAGPKKKGGSA